MNQGRSFASYLINVLAGLLCLVLIAAVLFPIFAQRRTSGPSRRLSNAKQCALALLIYADDADDRLPPALSWMDAVQPYVQKLSTWPRQGDADVVFIRPDAPRTDPRSYGYAMNVALSCEKTAREPKPADVALLFESVLLARNACSGFYGFPHSPPDGGNVVGFLDGHVRKLSPDRAAEFGPDGRKR